jgi:hypothetical protein
LLSNLTKLGNKTRLEGGYMLMAVILYYLQRREHRLEEIVEKLENVENEIEVKNALVRLEQRRSAIKRGDVYRINPHFGDLKTSIQKSMEEF